VEALGNFQRERHSFASTTDFEFSFLSGASFPALLLGLITTSIGSILWAWYAAIRHVALYGLGIVILLPLGLAFIPVNIHGWTAVFLFVGWVGILIGGLFLLFAGVRALSRRGASF
jgi:hypothetical protein